MQMKKVKCYNLPKGNKAVIKYQFCLNPAYGYTENDTPTAIS